jgi:hypothetical protein
MSHMRKPLAAVITIGLAVISLLLARGVWSQATYNHFFYLSLIARQHPPTPTPTATGWIGFYAVHGQVKSNATPAALIAQAVVSYTRYSLVIPASTGITLTDVNGSYSFITIHVRDTDWLEVRAQAEGFALQRISKSGLELRDNPAIDFALIPWTPTPTPCPECR